MGATSAFLSINSRRQSLGEGCLHGIADLLNRRSVNRRIGIAAQPTIHPVLETTVMEARVAVSHGVHIIAACHGVDTERRSLCGVVSADRVEDHPTTGRTAEIVIRLPGPRDIEVIGLL